MSRTLIKGEQIQLTDFIKALANANWNDDTLTVSAAAILAKIRSEIAGVSGAMQFRGDWSVAATDAASVTGIKKGYVYVYNGTGTAPTGVTLENGDTLIACTDDADITDPDDWVIINFNLTGAVTEATLVSALQGNIVAGPNITLTVQPAGSPDAGKLRISAAATYPTIQNGGGQNGKYISALSISNGVITVTYTDLPEVPNYKRHTIFGETPTGTMNGTNRVFVTQEDALDTDRIAVFVNGVRQKAGSGNDYTATIPSSGDNEHKCVITFETTAYIPQSGDSLLVDYLTKEEVIPAVNAE